MSWANLDDRLHAHPKVRRLMRQGSLGLEAFGLWSWSLTWARAYSPIDGWLLPVDDLADEWTMHSIRMGEIVALLVKVRLVDEVEDDAGVRYRIHDWSDWQYTQQQKGGKARAESAKRSEDGRFAPSSLDQLEKAGSQRAQPNHAKPNHSPPNLTSPSGALAREEGGAPTEFTKRVPRPS